MLNIEYRLKLGQDEFTIRGDYKNEKEFFNSMSFFSSLPKTAPNGATDLKLVVRETKKGKYYSLVSEQEKMEFQLGQHKEGDTLYAKGWVPLYQGDTTDQTVMQAPIVGAPPQQFQPPTVGVAPQAPSIPAYQPPVAPPVQMQPQYQPVQPAPAQPFNPQFPGMVPPTQGPSAATPVAPTIPGMPPMAPTTGNPVVAAQAASTLARFGIPAPVQK